MTDRTTGDVRVSPDVPRRAAHQIHRRVTKGAFVIVRVPRDKSPHGQMSGVDRRIESRVLKNGRMAGGTLLPVLTRISVMNCDQVSATLRENLQQPRTVRLPVHRPGRITKLERYRIQETNAQ